MSGNSGGGGGGGGSGKKKPKGDGSGGGGGSGGGANNGNGNGGGGAAPMLALEDKSNSSGKTLSNNDKSAIWKKGEKWDLTAIVDALKAKLGEWGGKAPCPFFFIGEKGCNRTPSSACQFHH